jgi:hypothetical protein
MVITLALIPNAAEIAGSLGLAQLRRRRYPACTIVTFDAR